MARADFITAVVLILLGLGALVESAGMPRFETLNIEPYTVPGIVPGVLSFILILLGMLLLVRACAKGGWRLDPRRAVALFLSPDNKRLTIALVLTLGYAAGLVGRVPYWLATVIFVFFFTATYEWSGDDGAGPRARKLATAGVQAVLVAIAVTVVFQEIFLVRLP
ncbi:hypothetical protein MNBD_ALPHA09-2373 [hydrothermal vent metagenome]|uniref:DUF1468 domain-containing protein n=1 Tax=hydrothermal vent metagenome TaxID=652676 RepID=A0A3B0TBQ9_9ZZZZ